MGITIHPSKNRGLLGISSSKNSYWICVLQKESSDFAVKRVLIEVPIILMNSYDFGFGLNSFSNYKG